VTVASGRQVFRFRITLRDIAPQVWREVEVPASYSLWDLHVAIQDAMGWDDRHLHVFRFPRSQARAVELGIPDPDLPVGEDSVLPDWEHTILEFFPEAGATGMYEYDFGDGWEHDVRLEAIVPRTKGVKYPRCTGGERACPPEDCGGPHGYSELLEILFDPQHEEFERTRIWVGSGFDPERFRTSTVRFSNPTARWKRAFGP
jgi:hypothetical protein